MQTEQKSVKNNTLQECEKIALFGHILRKIKIMFKFCENLIDFVHIFGREFTT